MELNKDGETLLPFQAALGTFLRAHTPSLTAEAEEEIEEVYRRVLVGEPQADVADLAIRYCSCGTRIDGYYEYIDHLRDQAGIRPALGSLPGMHEGDVPNG